MLLCVSMLSAAMAVSAATSSAEALFPIPQQGILLDSSGEGMSYEQLAQDFSKAAGIHLVLAPDLRAELSNWQVDVVDPLMIPAEHLYAVVEQLFVDHNLMLDPIGSTGIFRLSKANNAAAMFIAEEDIDSFSDHAALVAWTVIKLEHADSRQLANSLRLLCQDTHTQALVPAGNTNNLFLSGRVPEIAALAGMLKQVDAMSVPRPEPTPATEPEERSAETQETAR